MKYKNPKGTDAKRRTLETTDTHFTKRSNHPVSCKYWAAGGRMEQTYIHNNVRPGHEGRGIRCKEDGSVVQFVDISETVHGGA